MGWAARRCLEAIDVLPRRLAGRHRDPIPPRRLRSRVGAAGAGEYRQGGARAAEELEAGLGAFTGRSLAGASSILDFGCGSGRVLGHIAQKAASSRCVGCDVDRDAIGWAAAHLSGCEWVLSPFEPPLPFPQGSFALLYSISVFSHLDEHGQDRWLAELCRVLEPDGVALLSVHGRHALEQFRSGAVRTRWCPADAFVRPALRSGEFAFVPYGRSVWNAIDLPGVGSGYGLAFHDPDYVRGRWSGWFEVLDVRERAISGWQDLVVCRRRS